MFFILYLFIFPSIFKKIIWKNESLEDLQKQT
jgi:hypothetical protein